MLARLKNAFENLAVAKWSLRNSLYFYGSVSGIGNAADCKSVASAFLVRVQGGPPYGQIAKRV